MQLSIFDDGLVQEVQGELLVSSLVISENVLIEHNSVIVNIKKYKTQLEEFGPIDLKSNGINGTSSYKTWYDLNENQSMLLLTFLRNNDIVVDFKVNLVKSFSYMKQKLENKKLPTPLETAKMLVQVLEDKEKLLLTNKALSEQNTILMHTNNLYTATEIAKELNFSSANQLNKKLNEMQVQYRVNNNWVFYSKYADLGYTSIKQHILENGKVIYDRKFTQSGRDFILKLFSEVQNGRA